MVGQEGPDLGDSGLRTAPRSPHFHHTLHRIAYAQKEKEDLEKILDHHYRLDTYHSVLVANNRFRCLSRVTGLSGRHRSDEEATGFRSRPFEVDRSRFRVVRADGDA